jgi:hypothetical protein
MALTVEIRSQNASEEFGTFVTELKTAKLRGEESVRDAVQVINRFQTKFGDSEQELKKLAKAVGVHVATLYRWKKQIEGKTTAILTPKFTKVGQGGEKRKAVVNRFDQAWAFLEKLYHDVDEVERENDLNEIIKKWNATFPVYRDGRVVPGGLA